MSVERREKGGRIRWLARWRQDGRERSRTFDRRADALAFERERRREASLGAHGTAEPAPLPLAEWLRRWWGSEALSWAPSTRRVRASVLDVWIVPHLGGVRLRDLGPARVRAWRADLLTAGCPPTQANAALSVLSAALGAAVADGMLPANPCASLRRMPTRPTRPNALAPIEVERVRAAMPTLRDVVLVGLLAYAGLRPGEALALRWRDVGRVLVVDRAVSDGLIRETKTASRRTVEVVTPLAEDLDLLRPKVADPDALVAAGRSGGVLDLANWRRRVWAPACAAAGVKASPYDGRHTFASLLIHEGRALPYVTAAMGHASPVTTLRHYAHVMDEARLATGAPMVETIRAARDELASAGVYPMCTRRPVRALRSPAAS